MKKLIASLLICYVGINIAMAVVADPKPVTVRQSDRKELTIYMKGDERVSWAKTIDGYTLLRDSNDDYVYAIADGLGGIKLSKMLAHNPELRDSDEKAFVNTLDTNLFYSKQQISMMKQYFGFKQDFAKKLTTSEAFPNQEPEDYKMVVILMSFSDFDFVTPKEDIEALFNQVGYSVNGHPGSVHDYFVASSYGKLNLSATVVGPYKATKSVTYYGESQTFTLPNGQEYTVNDMHVQELIVEAVQAAKKDVDFSEYTNSDESNQVSCVYVLYAGYAQSQWGNPSYTIWPHRSHLTDKMYVNGAYVYDYGCSSEFDGNEYYTEPLKIGTICHEFSHVLGQPDYYDTDYEVSGAAFNPGTWDIMASGSYNNNSKFPPVWSTMERMVRGYVNVESMPVGMDVTLPDLQYENRSYISYYNNSANEYLIFENRQRTGWDSYLPGHGMLVFHVDQNVAGWNNNCINCDASDVGYAVIPANNTFNNNSMGGQPYPGISNKTSLTSTSSPNSNSKSNESIGYGITYIKENTNTNNITFYTGDVSMHVQIEDFTLTFRTDTLCANAKINNSQFDSYDDKGFVYSKTNYAPTVLLDTKVSDNTVSSSLNYDFTSLDKGEYYYIRPFVKPSGYSVYSYGETMKVRIPCTSVTDFPYQISFEDGQAECWQQEYDKYIANNWKFVANSEVEQDIQGPHSGEKYAYIHNDDTEIQTVKLISEPINTLVLDSPVLTFWHHQKTRDGNTDNLNIYYKLSASDTWTLLKSYTDNISDWTQETIDLTAKSGTLFLAFESSVKGGCGVAIDDIQITDANVSSWPSVSSDTVYNITNDGMAFKGTVLYSGYTALKSVGVVVGTQSDVTIDANNTTTVYFNGIPSSTYTVNVQGLESSTLYYARAFAQNQGLTTYGKSIPFVTRCSKIENFPYSPNLDSEDTTCFDVIDNKLVLPVMNLSYKDSMAVVYTAKASDNGSTQDVSIYYRNGMDTEWELINTTAFADGEEIVVNIPTANHQNDNSYIAFDNLRLSDYSAVLNSVTVKAVSQIPFVNTDTVYLSQYNQITASGTVSYAGMSDVSERGICYSANGIPTINDDKKTSGTGIGSFTVTLDNLSPLTTYTVRAYAVNSYGVTYGQYYTITTPFIPIFNNTITQDQTLCEGSIPQQLIGSTPTGGDNTFTYLWISSTDSVNWAECNEGSVSFNKSYEPRQLFNTTYYRRVVYSNTSIDTSNTVTITIDYHSKGGSVFPTVDTALQHHELRVELRAYIGNILYWEFHREGFEWQQLDNSADSVFFTDIPDNIGYYSYRAAVKSGVCDMAYSSPDSIYVVENIGLNPVNAGAELTIAPNPSAGEVFLISNYPSELANVLITVMDAESKTVYRQYHTLTNGYNRLNLQHLESGVYIIKAESKNISWNNKLIISK